MSGSEKRIKVSNIANYYENPRHPIASDEFDTLKKLFDSVGIPQMLNLASDIKAHGLLPCNRIVVVYSEFLKKYVVYEGNRRVAAIKLLLYPDTFTFDVCLYGVTFSSTPASSKSGTGLLLGLYPNQLSSIAVPIAPLPVAIRPVLSISPRVFPIASCPRARTSAFVLYFRCSMTYPPILGVDPSVGFCYNNGEKTVKITKSG